MDITERAGKYAEGKANEAMTNAIAQAYADGYRDGYKDCEEDIPVDLRDNKTEFVDLGLPSGTLWASDYIKEDEKIQYLTYDRASCMTLPTKDQWKELKNCCKWEFDIEYSIMKGARCVGPNGNFLRFIKTGMINAEKIVRKSGGKAVFWVRNDKNGDTISAVHIYHQYVPYSPMNIREVEVVSSCYKLPVRLVRKP